MSTLSFQAARLGQLRSADLLLAPGRYAVLSNEREALAAFVALATGRAAPRSGRVLLDAVEPVASPSARRRIAALYEDETPAPAPSVKDAVGRVLRARGQRPEQADEVLSGAGLAQAATYPTRSLGAVEVRTLALALALAHDSAAVLVLHEPLTTLMRPGHVLAALERHTERGAIVVVTTSSSADASLLGGSWLTLELGRLELTRSTPRVGRGPWQEVLVETSDPRALSRLLHDAALQLGTELTGAASQLKVTGPSLDATVREVIRAARSGNVEISRIEPALPPVEALMAARAGFARGAYEASRLAAHPQAAPSASSATEATVPTQPGGSA